MRNIYNMTQILIFTILVFINLYLLCDIINKLKNIVFSSFQYIKSHLSISDVEKESNQHQMYDDFDLYNISEYMKRMDEVKAYKNTDEDGLYDLSEIEEKYNDLIDTGTEIISDSKELEIDRLYMV